MPISIRGAREHNLRNISLDIEPGLTVVTGVSGSGKTSLVFDTLYHEARRRFLDIYAIGSATNRLSPANVDAITGLGPAVAVGQNLLNRNPNSTLATAAGLHPFLRLLFAHFGERTCPTCGERLFVYSEDELVDRLGALVKQHPVSISVPLLNRSQGSHRTLLELLMGQFPAEAILIDGAAWQGQALDPQVFHNIEVTLQEIDSAFLPQDLRKLVQEAAGLGSTAVKAYTGEAVRVLAMAPVCVGCGRWFGDLRPVHFNATCPQCAGKGCPVCLGSGMEPQAAFVRLGGLRFTELLALEVDQAFLSLSRMDLPSQAERLQIEIERRLSALQKVGLGYISLNRPAPTLSRGEAQRVRLALTLISRLEDMLHILDEPTIGQHPADVKRLLPAFRELAGPVVFVEHDRQAAAEADWAIDLGPGAGWLGGEVVFQGKPGTLWQADTATGRCFSLRERLQPLEPISEPDRFLMVRQANLRNLCDIDVPIPLERLTVVTGVSGSGKSTLVEDVLVASLAEAQPIGCRAMDGPGLKPVMVDQSPIGRNPRSNPATYTKLADLIRDLFAAASGLSASHFSFNRPEGACPTCHGLGAVEIAMRYLPPTWAACVDCDGERFSEDVLSARVQFGEVQFSIADFLDLTVSQALSIFSTEKRLPDSSIQTALRILQALQDIGVGYLRLGQPSPTLSGGEAQRVKLARYLGGKALTHQMLVLDEPSTGLHPQDLAGLLNVLRRLVRAGATIVIVEHNTDIIRLADWVIDLGPGAGPAGGRLLYAGPPAGLTAVEQSLTGKSLLAEEALQPLPTESREGYSRSMHIMLRQARVHNLKNVDVDFPKGKLSVVTGLSGSGKSSLVHDVLEAEARRRFLETLSLYERQGTHEGPEADVGSISGLGVALTVAPERLVYSRRATVGSATEITHHLAVLFAMLGERRCLECNGQMQRGSEGWFCPTCHSKAPVAKAHHFISSTYASACLKCNGVGSLQKPQPNKLIIHPEKPLINGAMYSPGFFPDGYLGKPYNGGYDELQALAKFYNFDPAVTPWEAMSLEAQQAFLFGSQEDLDVIFKSRAGRMTHRRLKFPGFYGFIRDWDVGGTYTDTAACPECLGRRLRKEYLAVTLHGYDMYQMSQIAFRQLAEVMAMIPKQGIEFTYVRNSLLKITERLQFLNQVGLSYLHLDRETGTLSAGEVQRVRLASLLGSGLTSLTLLLDEPTRGLHPAEVDALIAALARLRDEGNTVILVEHDLQVIRSADHLVDMGPGAGHLGGEVVAQGTPEQVAGSESVTAGWLRGTARIHLRSPRRQPQGWMKIVGARANNLVGETIALPLGVLLGVCGVSGSGKSTLILDTLGRALAPRKQTTSVAYEPVDPGAHDRIEGAPSRAVLVDQVRHGVSNPAAFLNLNTVLRSMFAESPDARALGVTAAQLSSSCSACGGSGVITFDMTFLPDVHLPCETCQGTGYLPEAWEVRLKGLSLPEVLGMTIDQVYDLFSEDERLQKPLSAARQVGLGYLVMRQPGYALSGGEVQRLKIAQELLRKSTSHGLYILDEPTVGQHLEDVQRLVGVLQKLVEGGSEVKAGQEGRALNSVFVVEHHPHLLAACDWLLELGPGGGPDGGRVIASGPPESLAAGQTPIASYLREVLEAAA